jgi:hypothetical protein
MERLKKSEMRGVIDRDADEGAFPASYASL